MITIDDLLIDLAADLTDLSRRSRFVAHRDTPVRRPGRQDWAAWVPRRPGSSKTLSRSWCLSAQSPGWASSRSRLSASLLGENVELLSNRPRTPCTSTNSARRATSSDR